ncbi:hypothetical protein KY284_026598 [Solanum tuberosum]|nr:hypothetical protein KY284_026598 [Solanum tuberosum]
MLDSNVSGCLPHYGSDILPSPSSMQGMFHPVISRQLISDSSKLQRETKRSRINGASLVTLSQASSVMPEFLLDNTILAMTTYGVALLPRMENFPDVLNCSTRTGLYNLAKYYSDAIVGFTIVFFYPNTDEDLASYTAFEILEFKRSCWGCKT